MMDKEQAKKLRKALEIALKVVGIQEKVTIQIGTMHLYPDKTTMTLTVTEVLSRDAQVALNKKMWEDNCRFYFLKPEYFGRTFTIANETYTVAGLNMDARKKVVLLTRKSDGKTCVCEPEWICKVLK